MKVLYSCEPPFEGGKSIFLVGPTPRDKKIPSWRPDAINLLSDLHFTGTVLVPERKEWLGGISDRPGGYVDQVDWEYAGLSQATIIAAWVPREMSTMPALTTNVEFGYWLCRSPDRLLYGRPSWAAHTRYLDWMYTKFTGREPINTLHELLKLCVFALENVGCFLAPAANS